LAVRRKRFSTRLGLMLVIVIGLLSLASASYSVVHFALTSPYFLLSAGDDVLVDGNRYVSRQEILSALGLPKAGPAHAINVFRLSLAERVKQLESIPWVRSATLVRAYPHRIVVRVSERIPVAFANVAGHLKLVDQEGLFLEKPERAAFDFPVLTGLDAAQDLTERKQRVALYLDLQKQVAEEASQSGWLISEVNVADGDDLQALVTRGSQAIQLHLGDGNFLERFRGFLALLPEVRKTNAEVDSMDLRYQNQIVVNPKGRE
jgi:cell division protein FtsQ